MEVLNMIVKDKILNLSLVQSQYRIIPATDGTIFSLELYNYEDDLNYISNIIKDTFEHIKNSILKINLYVTGPTPALVEVIKFCNNNFINLSLFHFNMKTNDFFEQPVLEFDYCGGGVGTNKNAAYCCCHCDNR